MIALYQIVDRTLSFVKMIDMEMPADPDSWLAANGYGRKHTLRRGKIIEVTKAERTAMHREHDRLKRAGGLPSARDAIMGKLTR